MPLKDQLKKQRDKRRTDSGKIGIVIVCVGKQGVGKSTKIREILKGVKQSDPNREMFIYDPNYEFQDYYPYERAEPFTQFLDLIENKKESLIFVEEATMFLDPRKKEGVIVDKMVKIRHEKNILIMNFHSFSSIPTYIFDMTHYLFVFKTNDSFRKVKNKCDFPTVLEAFEKSYQSENRYHCEIVELN